MAILIQNPLSVKQFRVDARPRRDRRRFGDNPLLFYACNVASSLATVRSLSRDAACSGLRNQTDWARIEAWKRQNDFGRIVEWAPLVERMQSGALRMRIPNPNLRPRLRRWDRFYSGASL